MSFCNFSYFPYWFLWLDLVLIAQVPGLCIIILLLMKRAIIKLIRFENGNFQIVVSLVNAQLTILF